LKVASVADAATLTFTQIEFWIARALATGKLKRK